MALLRNPFDPSWGILMTLTRKNWGILLDPDSNKSESLKINILYYKFKIIYLIVFFINL